MDEIRELAGRLTTLTDDELANLVKLIRTEGDKLDTEDTDEATAALGELGELSGQIMGERESRAQKAQEAKEARDSAREQINALGGDEDETETDDQAGGEEEPEEPEANGEGDMETDAQAEEAPAAEPVVADGAVQKMARRAPKPAPSPEAQPDRPIASLTASAGHEAGRAIVDRDDLAREMIGHLERLDRRGPYGKVIVASARLQYPEDRRVGNSPEDIAIVERICGPGAQAYDPRTGQATGKTLVATGGICQPVNVDYAISTYATADTPIVNGLPSFEATRGGIRFVQPPDVAEWEGATGIWPEATDAEPAGQTKPVKSLACGNEVSAYVEAISTRIGFGNMQSRFAPEQVAANTDMALAAAARVREENLLNLIEGLSVKKLETAQHLGYARDLLAAVDYALAAYRNIHRIPRTQAFTAIFPEWVKDLIRTDIAREQAHDNSGSFNVWEITDEQIDSLFAMRHLNVIWHLDGQKEPASKNYKSQYWGTPAEGKKLDELLPNEVLPWYIFPEGAVQRLDAGRLDLGVVRDSTLDATNDYETFVEVFETVVQRSFANGVWQVLSALKATGGSAATVTAVAP